MEEPFKDTGESNNESPANRRTDETVEGVITADEKDVRILSVDKLTVEKIVLEKAGSQVLFTKSESSKKLSESTKTFSTKTNIHKLQDFKDKKFLKYSDFNESSKCSEKSIEELKNADNSKKKISFSKLPVWKSTKITSPNVSNERRIKSVKFDKGLVKESQLNSHSSILNPSKICKVSPTISPEPLKKIKADRNKKGSASGEDFNNQGDSTNNSQKLIQDILIEDVRDNKNDEPVIQKCREITQRTHNEIEKLQKNLVKVNSVTIETFKQKLPILHSRVLKISTSPDLDLNENITRVAFDKNLSSQHDFNKNFKVEDKTLLETDFDYALDGEKLNYSKFNKPKYSREVSEVEKRWSGEFLENHFENSSGSSKSSYIEEIGSISSHGSFIEDSHANSNQRSELHVRRKNEALKKSEIDEILEDTVSTVDSTSCLEDRIKAIDEDINQSIKFEKNHDGSESRDSTLKKSSSTDTCYQIEEVQVSIETNKKQSYNCQNIELKRVFIDEETEEEDCEIDDQSNFIDEKRECTEVERVIVTEKEGECMQSDGYAELIKEITMDPGSSKSKDEKKKKGGLRRLLPGLFSPKDSRKDYKKEQKERKKRDERHFSQYQQNGIYTRSPDTMHLNEDIRRNVNLDTSLNGTIIEERLNEIKQELFPEPGMTTSTPDHFIQNDRNHMQGQRAPKIYTANSSLSSIAVEDKWIDQNIISGSPDMRKLKAHIRNDNDSKCSLERKHSLQESQPRFLRNHGPSGRISAPPSERYLIRPRAVHPIDRPLPAIPQKVEYVNYENHPEIHQVPNNYPGQEITNYQMGGYYPNNQNYANEAELFENGNHIEKAEVNKNYSIDSGFNLTPVSGQMKMNHNHVVNQSNNMNNNNSSQKTPFNHGRSPKYSPSSSQKSGDYADSSYTPNSSQKSEFSPGSSKSGEYYLNSPRNSSRMSPDDNFNDQRDQTDHEPLKNGNYQVPSSIRVQNKDDHVYDEAPRSPFEEDKSPGISKVQNNNQETVYGQRGSPNIPLSSNLAKLRANVENSSRSESTRNFDGRLGQSSQIPSPVASGKVSTLSIQSSGQRDLVKSPLSNTPRVTSPLTVVTPVSPTSCVNTMSPNGVNRSRSTTPSGSMSPARILTLSQETPRLTISPSTINHVTSNSLSTFHPRKAQPTDQILIASPKRELIYDTQPRRPPSRLEAGCPDSPVPMAESPCRISSPRPNFRQNIAELDRAKSPIMEMCEHPPPQAFQDQPQRIPMQSNRPMSPRISEKTPEKGIQRPEPIYSTRSPQRAISPLAIKADQRTTSLAGGKTNMLLIPARPDNVNSIALSPSKLQEDLAVKNLHGVNCTQEQHRVQSPRPMSPQVHKESINSSPEQAEKLQLRKKESNYYHERPQAIYDEQNNLIREKNTVNEPIYARRTQPSPVPDHMMTPIYQHPQKHQIVSQQYQGPRIEQPRQQIYVTKQEICASNQEQIYGRQSMPEGNTQRNQNQEKIYGQTVTETMYGQNKQLSPSKKQMMQHLEAFYWQQKALEAQKNAGNSPNKCQEISVPNPEVREAIYWQQLKKLDEEQQRKIYERNQFEEKSDPIYWKKKIQSSSPSPTIQVMKQNSPSLSSPNRSQVQAQIEHHSDSCEQIYWRNKSSPVVNPSGKPPLAGQKGQNQPVLVVRPQQAVRESTQVQFIEQELKDPSKSKNLSPYFVRNDERRSLQIPRKSGATLDDTRKSSTSSIYDDTEIDKKQQPPPIFKRGSLISNSSSSVEYNTMGPKRVSFSNQSNSPEIGSGNWPTKHGMAPEPPTRKHRTEEKILPDANVQSSRFNADDQNSINIYGNASVCSSQQQQRIYDIDYDADKPLPPPPPSKDPWMLKRSNSMKDPRNQRFEVQRLVQVNPRKMSGLSESESGSEAGEVQKILQRRHEEEWNPGGKGRQSNDTGGSGRPEGEGGSNDLPGGRRSGSGGVLGISIGGRVTGTSGGGGGRSRDEPRRHTLSGDHAPSLHHQQFNAQQLHPLHPHHLPPPHGQYGTPQNRHTTMDLEMGTKSRQRKSPLPRGYPPPSTAMLFDDDPGIMSEVETSSTGFRRGGKQRSSLPVVRTPSKTLERPLGLVFLQYRKETKRALLPNEVTCIGTVKALFVRSFPKQLTMEYLDSPDVKVYIHDSSKDMFYELEDHRSHLRDIRDRSVLRLIEKNDGLIGMTGPLGATIGGPPGLPPHWEDQSYFSEPEFDSEYQHQHIHKSKTAKNSSSATYYMGGSSTLPRGGPIMRAYSPAAPAVLAGPNATPAPPKALGTPGGGGVAPAKPLRGYQCGKSPLGSLGGSARFSRDSSVSLYSIPDRLHGESGYMSSPERGGGVGANSGRYPAGPYSTGSSYEEPYYSQYSGTVTPVIDEEASDTELLEETYGLYGGVKPPGRPPSGPPRSPFPPGTPALPGQAYDVTRIRVEHMERQLANLTGLVQQALTHAPHTSPSPRDYLQVPAGRDPYTRSAGAGDEFDKHSSSSSASLPDDSYLRTDVKPPKLGKDKSVSFEKSVSFSDEPPDMNSPKQHSPQHTADTKPTKPAIKSSTLPRMSSQERDRHKPTPPPKPVSLASAGPYVYRDLALTPEMYNQLRGLQKKAKDLRQEVRHLRRMSQTQAHTVRETIRDTFITIRAMLLSGADGVWAAGDSEKMRLSREEDLYKQEMIRLEKDLTELESTVEELRGNVINRKTRVNMSDVENMALILSKSSKTVADLKVRFPSLQESMKGLLSSEMEKVAREEKFLKEEPDRLESALRRCKKLTGTLVTLKRLASVQEQRLPNAVSLDAEETPPITPTSAQHSKTTAPVPTERTVVGSTSVIGGGTHLGESSTPHQQRPENALDALLDELQTFSRPSSQLSQVSNTSQTLINHIPTMVELGRSASQIVQSSGRAPNISDIGRKGSIDSSSSLAIIPPGSSNTLRRLHSYPSSSDTDTSPPIARIQVSDGTVPPQKPPVPERNAELLQLATARRVPPPPPPRTSSRSPLASPTSPQLPPRNPTGTLRRGRPVKDIGKPPMALPPNAEEVQKQVSTNNMLSTSNSSSCESINSQEGLQNKKERQEQLEQRHQELLRKQKALQEQYARLQQLQRNTSGLTAIPPAPPDLLKKTGSESNLLAKMGLGMSAATSGSLTSLAITKSNSHDQSSLVATIAPTAPTTTVESQSQNAVMPAIGNQTTTNKIYETDIL